MLSHEDREVSQSELELLLLPSKLKHTRNLLWSIGAEQKKLNDMIKTPNI